MARKPDPAAAERLRLANEKRHLEALARGSRKATGVERQRVRRTSAASAGAAAASLQEPQAPPAAASVKPARKPAAKPAGTGEATPPGDPAKPGALTRFWRGGLRGLLGRDSD